MRCDNPKARASYLHLAESWRNLATIEENAEHGTVVQTQHSVTCMPGHTETLQERGERFLRSAAEAEAFAKRAAEPLLEVLCLFMAKQWRQMATEIEPDD